ncbi:MAG: NAD-dependent epimerase [Synechococcales cyanobacterium M58_A2018_015]|nr:NAD-dependent epimerase [Synechococcales cyanobacterium M58_A2018_015]
MSTILVTGAAGFIGFHVSQRLLEQGHHVVGIDNLNDYYDVNLKLSRLIRLQSQPQFQFHKLDLADRLGMESLFTTYSPDRVVHLAAQAGVRYSLTNPHTYVDSNLVGFLHVLEGCRQMGVQHLVFASSSSVYGANRKLPFSVEDNVDHPISLYAATKKANELMAHTYSHLYGIPTTGLRFFTVYGPWGRPDMATFSFTRSILEGKPIEVYNHGEMKRDFTYIDDVVEGVIQVLDHVPCRDELGDASGSQAPYRIYNIGNHQPVELLRFIEVLETSLGRKAEKNLLPLQPGDVLETYADIEALRRDIQFEPKTPIEVGIPRFVDWYCSYYGVAVNPRSVAAVDLR